ncbi:SDR family NAD(P)-dependent oxidoreductase, partial [Mycolicibacterium moriokaense]|uniref:SDR family NAD(P)-dependent oxidoreductase n=1 Tax=Mycolicibacterium moriokaense TaxID=39691 RepID=UPI001055C0CE
GWRDVIDVNLTGAYHTVEVAIPTLIEQGEGGAIVLTSSVAGLIGNQPRHRVGDVFGLQHLYRQRVAHILWGLLGDTAQPLP